MAETNNSQRPFGVGTGNESFGEVNVQSLPLHRFWSANDAVDMSNSTITSAGHNLNGTAFHGSFAPIAQRRKVIHKKPWYRRKEYFTDGWLDAHIWRAGIIEGVGTFCLVYLLAQFGMSLMNYGTVQTGAYIGLFCWAMLAVLVYCLAPASGAHMNCMVTFTTVLCGLCPLSRGVIYMIFQLVGASLAGGVMVGSWGVERTLEYQGTGCFYDSSVLTTGQVLIMESAADFIILFLVFGVGLDPRQSHVFGPHLVPALVGLSFGVVAFVNSATAPGYGGANMNPAKCFGFAVATQDFSTQWIWWVAGLTGSLFQAILYNFNPPWVVPDENTPGGKPRAP
ncbi:hypothetical protein DL765_011381 [Monosporascus sp. GIB2]|nr:hypothetical protein DL765_011381 [Monosporascus sp. GIB2]